MTKRIRRLHAFAPLAFAAALFAAGGCATETPPPVVPVNPALAIDADPMALLPGGMVALGDLDSRAFYASGSLGAQVAAMTESILPMGREVGFSAFTDVDRVYVAFYAGAAIDGVSILQGRFDSAKMQAAVAGHAAGRSGLPWAVAPYAGHTLYSTANMAFAPLTDHTLAAGNESAVRRVLDRLAQPGPRPNGPREIPDWMEKTLETPGSSFALAAGRRGAIPPAALQGWSLPGCAVKASSRSRGAR